MRRLFPPQALRVQLSKLRCEPKSTACDTHLTQGFTILGDLHKVNNMNTSTQANDDRHLIYNALLRVVIGIVAMWGLYFLNEQFGLGLKNWGNRPLTTEGLVGILSMPFLHGDFEHLWGNTISWFTLGSLLFYFYRSLGAKVLLWTYLGGGVLLWLSGAGGNHIGASGVVYGLAAFLFLSGPIRRHPNLMWVSLVVAFLYGGIIWYVMPVKAGVSWEGHLAGALVGAVLAWTLRNRGPVRPVYQWQIDEQLELEEQREAEREAALELARLEEYWEEYEALRDAGLND